MSDLNPYEESLAYDLGRAQARIKELEQAERQTYRDALELAKQVDALSEQLAAARKDAEEAEAYAEELEKERDVASIWNEAVDEALDILDDEGWLGESRERIELLKKPLGGKDAKSNL